MSGGRFHFYKYTHSLYGDIHMLYYYRLQKQHNGNNSLRDFVLYPTFFKVGLLLLLLSLLLLFSLYVCVHVHWISHPPLLLSSFLPLDPPFSCNALLSFWEVQLRLWLFQCKEGIIKIDNNTTRSRACRE